MMVQSYGQVLTVLLLVCLGVIQKIRHGRRGVDGYVPFLSQTIAKNAGETPKVWYNSSTFHVLEGTY